MLRASFLIPQKRGRVSTHDCHEGLSSKQAVVEACLKNRQLWFGVLPQKWARLLSKSTLVLRTQGFSRYSRCTVAVCQGICNHIVVMPSPLFILLALSSMRSTSHFLGSSFGSVKQRMCVYRVYMLREFDICMPVDRVRWRSSGVLLPWLRCWPFLPRRCSLQQGSARRQAMKGSEVLEVHSCPEL